MWQDRLGESRKIRASRVLSIIEQLGALQENLKTKRVLRKENWNW
jgi:hypothetical protein